MYLEKGPEALAPEPVASTAPAAEEAEPAAPAAVSSLTPENLALATAAALQGEATKPPPPPKRLSPAEEQVALQRKWALVHPGDGMPEGLKELRVLIPSGLKPMEVRTFLRGSLGEAKRTFLVTLNQSWSKTELKRRLLEVGAPHALLIFEPPTRKALEGAIRMLSD